MNQPNSIEPIELVAPMGRNRICFVNPTEFTEIVALMG